MRTEYQRWGTWKRDVLLISAEGCLPGLFCLPKYPPPTAGAVGALNAGTWSRGAREGGCAPSANQAPGRLWLPEGCLSSNLQSRKGSVQHRMQASSRGDPRLSTGGGGGSKWPVRTMISMDLSAQQQQALPLWVVIHSDSLVLFLGLVFSG